MWRQVRLEIETSTWSRMLWIQGRNLPAQLGQYLHSTWGWTKSPTIWKRQSAREITARYTFMTMMWIRNSRQRNQGHSGEAPKGRCFPSVTSEMLKSWSHSNRAYWILTSTCTLPKWVWTLSTPSQYRRGSKAVMERPGTFSWSWKKSSNSTELEGRQSWNVSSRTLSTSQSSLRSSSPVVWGNLVSKKSPATLALSAMASSMLYRRSRNLPKWLENSKLRCQNCQSLFMQSTLKCSNKQTATSYSRMYLSALTAWDSTNSSLNFIAALKMLQKLKIWTSISKSPVQPGIKTPCS